MSFIAGIILGLAAGWYLRILLKGRCKMECQVCGIEIEQVSGVWIEKDKNPHTCRD